MFHDFQTHRQLAAERHAALARDYERAGKAAARSRPARRRRPAPAFAPVLRALRRA